MAPPLVAPCYCVQRDVLDRHVPAARISRTISSIVEPLSLAPKARAAGPEPRTKDLELLDGALPIAAGEPPSGME
jgi:hypothetical protein